MKPEQFAAKITGLIPRSKRDAMQRAVYVVHAQAMREAPVKTGNLRRSIASRVEAGGNRGVIGTNAKYARAVHDGSRPHLILPRYKRALFWKGAKHPVRSVRHPGTRGNPFFERAINTARPAVERELAAWGNKLWAGVR